MKYQTLAAVFGLLLFTVPLGRARVTFTDDFSTPVNYLTNGVVGTIWDGIYLGAGEMASATGVGAAAGSVSVADADITGHNLLTVASVHTDWENAADDGFFLFKVITNNADFDMSVHVIGPIDNGPYNLPGLMVRAFGAEGSPSPNGAENSLIWARFDEFNIANMSKNNVNGSKTDIGRGSYPNANYWLRLTKVNATLRMYEKAAQGDAWISVGTVSRSDFTGVPLQVGIEHSDFGGGATRTAQYDRFSLSVTNMGPFAAAPSPAAGLTVTTSGGGTALVSWIPGAGSAGSVVVIWPGTSPVVREAPANGFTYNGNAGYGLGDSLPGVGQYVVYAGPGSSVTVTNLGLDATYNVAVFAYAGSGGSTAYDRMPPTASFTVNPNQVVARVNLEPPDVVITFSANPGEWYRLQYSDSLNPPNWQNVGTEPVLANSSGMVLVHVGGGLAARRFYRLQQMDPFFGVKTSSGAITSIQREGDGFATEYLAGRLGDANLKYRPASDPAWHSSQTISLSGVASVTYSTSPDGTQYRATYEITDGLAGALVLESVFTFHQDVFFWTLNMTNLTGQPVVIGDLALPLPMNTTFGGITSSVFKHSFISGNGSFLFWMRPNSVGPHLLMTPLDDTSLEFWDNRASGGVYEAYIHSYVAGTNAAAQYPSVITQGDRWLQPNTSLTLAAGASQAYGFKFQWADDYDGVRQALVDDGKIDVHIVPGMTVPTNLFAQIALRSVRTINSVAAEFPAETRIQYLGANGDNELYQVQFSRLGENKLTIQYGSNQTMYLEFFVTEPIETLIKKRAEFLVSKQVNDSSKWYNGLYCDWNMNDGQLITPDNHDTLGNSFQVYEIASDDAGESRPAYMAEKEAVYPVQSEVTSLDNYIYYFVWNSLSPTGGLQRTTSESFSYGIYGVPDWHQLRSSGNLSLGRGYDYPHIFTMYYGMYRVAKYHPEITTYLSATDYLTRAYGTAMAMWSYGGGQATHIGLMNELVIPGIIDALQAEGMTNEAANLRTNWETKVNYYVSGNANLFGSEYAFDSTGFESQEAYASYAVQHAGSGPLMGSTNLAGFLELTTNFMTTQITANMFDRGWLETAYYHYGSDYRGGAGDNYVLSYMSQMGGWGLLDYALNYAADPTDYLRLGYASCLSAWATMNSGPAPDYGFWYPGADNDGGCGGGFEPSPYNTTWLAGQPQHRGPWYYSAEENLGFCGALRSAATILADDPIFGRFCYGGTWSNAVDGLEIIPLDGVRQRFHAMFASGNLHLALDNDRFAASQPIVLQSDLSRVSFQIESDNPGAHSVFLRLTTSTPGSYTLTDVHGLITTVALQAGEEAVLSVPMDAGSSPQLFTIAKQ